MLVKHPKRWDEMRFIKRDLSRQQGRQKSQFYKWEQTLGSRSDLQPLLLGSERHLWAVFLILGRKEGASALR